MRLTLAEDHNMDDQKDQFHEGLHVLAIDDDQACLVSLESLLRRCQYHVTTTKNAMTALKLLRENKSMFDLVISDVHLPDMDGFKLLELVRREMNLPVILVSVNDAPRMVMKGFTLGASAYLKKPVKIEMLRNICQHIMRTKKLGFKEQNKTRDGDKPNADSSGSAATGNSDHCGKFSRKSDHDNEELHNKSVSAFNQLGIKKDVSKRTIDLLNVENLTKANMASHLENFRLLMEGLSPVANQKPNMVASSSTSASSNLTMSSLSGGKTVMEDHSMDNLREQFPNGLPVLVVDDNQTCLMTLKTLLRGCEYHVTTTKNAKTALKLFRENKAMFDLVISDINMPDTDGLKLLKLVVLEMDLPMIILSAHGDPKVVMKGVTHGACDYVVKPVNTEELKNIWQHVIKRKKDDLKDQTDNADSTNAKPSTEREDLDECEDWELL